jgi:hypothetical protein
VGTADHEKSVTVLRQEKPWATRPEPTLFGFFFKSIRLGVFSNLLYNVLMVVLVEWSQFMVMEEF